MVYKGPEFRAFFVTNPKKLRSNTITFQITNRHKVSNTNLPWILDDMKM